MTVDADLRGRLFVARRQVSDHLDALARFWLDRSVDTVDGGYVTSFDAEGRPGGDHRVRYLVTQARMVWAFTRFAALSADADAHLAAARHGLVYLIDHFWDADHGGWRWRVDAADGPGADAKLVYGQVFALYALATFADATGDERALRYAAATFDLLQVHAADTRHGGYLENFDRRWVPAGAGAAGGDRKSLDVHLHVMEAFTALAAASGRAVHERRLVEVVDVITSRCIDHRQGCGGNQYTLDWRPRAPIPIANTFNAERDGGAVPGSVDTTSYGHNLELAWLLVDADRVIGRPADAHAGLVARLAEHALAFGVDHLRGGVYRDGPHEGPALVRDKEFWQQAEALVGLLEALELTGDVRFAEAFLSTWNFVDRHVIDHARGEWRTLVDPAGRPRVAALGGPWKAAYHTGRAAIEVVRRLDRILGSTSRVLPPPPGGRPAWTGGVARLGTQEGGVLPSLRIRD